MDLQELIAPEKTTFYDGAWTPVGQKRELAPTLSAITGVSESILTEESELSDHSVAARLSWAASRNASRIEDRAYSLLGILGVFMPMLYGEGSKAFRRLQEEIIKRSNDLTIFAWSSPYSIYSYDGGIDRAGTALLADSPDFFASMGNISPFRNDFFDFSLTNKGVLVPEDLLIRLFSLPGRPGKKIYGIYVGAGEIPGGIYLRKIGPHLFQRCRSLSVLGLWQRFHCNQIGVSPAGPRTYIVADPSRHTDTLWQAFRSRAIHVPKSDTWKLIQVAPDELWDVTDRVLLRRSTYDWDTYPIKVAFRFKARNSPATIDVHCYQEAKSTKPLLTVSQHHRVNPLHDGSFHDTLREEPVRWPSDEHAIVWHNDEDTIEVRYPGYDTVQVRVYLYDDRLPGMDPLTTIYSLRICD
ncbi:Vegetative incompatibility protein HET-E-1 [Cyphellophora attinorum]|uniref:Vegetative incompatibility protein HET-E-1 n=1 Tax=Cyphellophora attinorum TaxID=1664694 RepID=A0A0N1HG85_9EURO|nr:Vegetative incompatibility protein HET-E-1 [Phialophora attinorum]KPI44504.1 Vegetative incompatibility protein HET-E-1 [Phialophora attinorum]